jgi:hypothetical protein
MWRMRQDVRTERNGCVEGNKTLSQEGSVGATANEQSPTVAGLIILVCYSTSNVVINQGMDEAQRKVLNRGPLIR